MQDRKLAAAMLRRLLTGCLLAALTACGDRPPPQPLPHEAYVWQRQWQTPVVEAVAASAPIIARWRVLAAEIDRQGKMAAVRVDAQALLRSGRPAIATVRIEAPITAASQDRLVAQVARLAAGGRNPAWRPAGIEIDHDAGLSALPAYAAFLAALRRSLPADLPLSITALPAWLDAPATLSAVLSPVDHAVLQLHAADAGGRLFDAAEAKRATVRFARLGKPFLIALPTYGSRELFDAHGRRLGVESETPAAAAAAQSRELFVSPRVVAQFLQDIDKAPPTALRGIVWFRLPTAVDQRAWSAGTWHAVIGGAPLTPVLSTAFAGHTLILRNGGAIDAEWPTAVRVVGDCDRAAGSAAYTLEAEPGTHVWRRKSRALLRAGGEVEVGRLRCRSTRSVSIDP